jgi:hypothetical protein
VIQVGGRGKVIKRVYPDIVFRTVGKFYILSPLDQNTNGKVFSKVLPFVHDGGPFGTVPELLFEKKQLIPPVQQLLAAGPCPPA